MKRSQALVVFGVGVVFLGFLLLGVRHPSVPKSEGSGRSNQFVQAHEDSEAPQKKREPDVPKAQKGSAVSTPRLPAKSSEPTLAVRREEALKRAPEVFRRFAGWVERYRQSGGDHALVEEGMRLGKERRTALNAIIRSDPVLALELAAPAAWRKEVPGEIAPLLEERVSTVGDYYVIASLPPEGEMPPGFEPIRREATVGEQRYRVNTFGRNLNERTRMGISLQGIAVDGEMALSDSPLRILEAGETPSADKTVEDLGCPVSGKEAGYDQEPQDNQPDIIAESGNEVFYLCSAGHIQAVEEAVLMAQGLSGGASLPTGVKAPVSPSINPVGPISILYIRINFPDDPTDPQSEEDSYRVLSEVSAYFQENSNGRAWLVPTVTPLITMTWPRAYYKARGDFDLDANEVRELARQAGYDTDNYMLDAFRYNLIGGGRAFVGYKGCWLGDGGFYVVAHELGHNLGLLHANAWAPFTVDPVGQGTNTEYGNGWSVMGRGGRRSHHFTNFEKTILQWLPEGGRTPVRTSGTYRIHAHDRGILDPSLSYGFTVTKDPPNRFLWGEFRHHPSLSGLATNGLFLNFGAASASGSPQLIDSNPFSEYGGDSAIAIGRTFSDVSAEIHITPLRKNTATVPESLDVQVYFGPFPGNNAPVISDLTASAVTAPLNGPLTFRVTASDPDADALAYHWDFGDGTYGYDNLSFTTKAWSNAGRYLVRCVVSDMKGRTASRSVLVTVGSPTGTSIIRGRVTDTLGNPVADAIVDNNPSGPPTRSAVTDSDGTYVLTRIAPGTHNLRVRTRQGPAVTSGFTNPVVVGTADLSDRNFVVTPGPTVSLTFEDAVASEAGPKPARFTITRSGPTTAPLTVRARFGRVNATYLSTFNTQPALNSAKILHGYDVGTFTIPASSSSLAVQVIPVSNTLQQGEQDGIVELVADPAYQIGSSTTGGSFIVEDDDTSRPTVSFSPANRETADGISTRVAFNSTTPAIVRVVRTGPITAPLAVNYFLATGPLDGNQSLPIAVPGQDYAALPKSVVIPAGSRSADILIQPLARADFGASRFIGLSMISSSSFIVKSSASRHNVELFHPNLPVVTISTPDDLGSAVSGDPARFTVTRSGSLQAPLVVPYGISGTALHGADYRSLPGSVTIPSGQASAEIVVIPNATFVGSNSKTVVLTPIADGVFRMEGATSAQVTLTGDTRTLWVNSNDAIAVEGSNDNARFIISRGGNLTAALVVNYTISGTAVNGVDVTLLSGTVTLGANQSSVSINVVATDDPEVEQTESLTLSLNETPGYVLSPSPSATVVIRDNDNPSLPVVTIGPYNFILQLLSESITTVPFLITRTGSTSAPLTVSYTVAGTSTPGVDFKALTGSVTIPAGQAETTLDLELINDQIAEGVETIVIKLVPNLTLYRIEGSGEAMGIINDDDVSNTKLSFVATSGSGPESGGTIPVLVRLSPASSERVTVDYAVGTTFPVSTLGSGVDFVLPPGQLVFEPGETQKTIPLRLIDDQAPEPDETLTIVLRRAFRASVNTAQGTYTYRIHGDAETEALPATSSVAFHSSTSSFFEASGSASVRVVRSGTQLGATQVPFTVSGSAGRPGDHGLVNGTLAFANGETEKLLTIPIVNDTQAENDETVVITLGTPVGVSVLGAPQAHTLTINDNDGTTAAITSIPPGSALSGKPFAYTIVTTGSPTPAISVTGLPAWLTRSGNTLSGIPPTPHTLGPITVTAANNAGPAATQQFSVDIRSLTPFQIWTETHFSGAELSNPLISGPTADPDGDSLVNLLEYALGLPPRASSAGPEALTSDDGRLQIRFTRLREDVVYQVETSLDLSSWSILATDPGVLGLPTTVTDTISTIERPRFLRLRVSLR